jgi:phage recombination protein Bet
MSKAIAKKKADTALKPIQISKEDVRRLICATASDAEIMLFVKIAQSMNLDPWKREVYLVKYGGKAGMVVTGYQTYLKRAARHPQWNGYKVWTETPVDAQYPTKAKIVIHRKDWTEPFEWECDWSECAGKTKEGKITAIWKQRPNFMLKKCVIGQGFRLCFPDECGGLPYLEAELVGTESPGESTEVMAHRERWQSLCQSPELNEKEKTDADECYDVTKRVNLTKWWFGPTFMGNGEENKRLVAKGQAKEAPPDLPPPEVIEKEEKTETVKEEPAKEEAKPEEPEEEKEPEPEPPVREELSL